MTEITIQTAADVDEAAQKFIDAADPERTVYAFHGEMGAGKTTFINALVRHLGVEEDATGSPTFAIVNEYRSDTTAELIYHFDLYRIESMEEAFDMGLEDYLESGCLCLIEWPERVAEMLPDDTVDVNIRVNPDGSRTLTIAD